jgi:hypothetical protein
MGDRQLVYHHRRAPFLSAALIGYRSPAAISACQKHPRGRTVQETFQSRIAGFAANRTKIVRFLPFAARQAVSNEIADFIPGCQKDFSAAGYHSHSGNLSLRKTARRVQTARHMILLGKKSIRSLKST